MSVVNSVVAIYDAHEKAEHAIKELQEAGVDMKSLSIVAKDTHTDEHVIGYYNAGDRMKRWGKIGAFWGGFWGLLFGSAFFAIPGIGPILVAGPLVGLDNRRPGRRRGGWGSERNRSRAHEYRYSQG